METFTYRLANTNFFCYTCGKAFKVMCDPTRPESVSCQQCHGEFLEIIPYKARYPESYQVPPVQNILHPTTQQEPRRIYVEFVYMINPIFFFPNPNSRTEQMHPASKSAIEKLEKVSVDQSIMKDEKACAVCCNDFKEGEEVQRWPCKHMFHSACTKPWLETHNTCPVCRQKLPCN